MDAVEAGVADVAEEVAEEVGEAMVDMAAMEVAGVVMAVAVVVDATLEDNAVDLTTTSAPMSATETTTISITM